MLMTKQASRPHTFHIPVMGTGFSIDTPLKIAKYGISSVISLVDDVLIEQMRELHCRQAGEPFEPIPSSEDDARARRITAYLDMVDLFVARQVEQLRAVPFGEGSDITRYYELLPDGPLKQLYEEMLETEDSARRGELETELRQSIVPGSIDVNIMTKVDRVPYRKGAPMAPEHGDAMTALRGYARSTLNSSIVLSAGLNPQLYNYISVFEDFFPDAEGRLRKKIILKVSDFRSALVQGRYLAKHGLWVSEFRVESGLNCGGHVFPSAGQVVGPILEEFKSRRDELVEQLHPIYEKSLTRLSRSRPSVEPSVRVTVQGGISTAFENELMFEYYGVDGTGWGTPFLLVPEVTHVDSEHLKKLIEASGDDVYLSRTSPFGVPFWSLRNSASEEARREKIRQGAPGSACPKGYIKLTPSPYSDAPVCTGSRFYQKHRLEALEREELPELQREAIKNSILQKACICHDLAGGATIKNGIDPEATPAVCCGPNIEHFKSLATLDEMASHIYGRISLLLDTERPNLFLRELKINVQYLREEIDSYVLKLSSQTTDYFEKFRENLLGAIDHYRNLTEEYIQEHKDSFQKDLDRLGREIRSIVFPESANA